MAVRDPDTGPGRGRCRTLLAVVLVAAIGLLAAAGAHASGKNAVLILDANTGRVLHASAADEPRHPASLAKMMTLYLAFELIEQGRLSYHTKLKISANAAETEPTELGLDEGDEIALIDAMKAVITKSANDMAVAIGEHIAGSEEKFAKLMTQRARQIGMASTTFRNASGLPDDEQITTARDMVTLALRLIDDYPKHYALFSTKTFTYKDETFSNHNTLLSNYEGTDGVKTGYTRASGFNLVSSVRRGRKHVVGAVFGGASAAARNAAMRTFLNMALVKASSEKTRRPAPLLLAQAKPVPVPRRVERPAPQPAAAAMAVAPSPAEAAAGLRLSPAIEVARVRPVLLAPRQADPAAADAGSGRSASFEEVLARAEMASQRPAAPLPTWATASAAGSLRSDLAAAPAEKPALLADPTPARGAQPSTLQQQAANLERHEPAVAAVPAAWPEPAVAPLQAPAPVPARARASPVTTASNAAAGAFQIQIGAYQSQAEAERRLASARELAPGLLADRAPMTTQVKQGTKLYFRARYAGFEAPAAATACSELKRLKIDCLVMKAE